VKIYTKKGDAGETALFGGTKVHKGDLRIRAYGSVDELNSVIGICRSFNAAVELDSILDEIQHDLFTLGADLASPKSVKSARVKRIAPVDIKRLERRIDAIDPSLEPLKNFILPGGNRSSAFLHFARTVCRRAERMVVTLARHEKIGPNPVIYLNRLSDLLFVLARWSNALSHTPEVKWKK